ncbi:RNA polymerase sigma factor [Anaerohalosphaera lusitana]|uniref:RNA polymerase sigma factor n=1 Tax=Anaerohalosphaera lusitana TaxID=1936003 RepID=A0A1U9NKY1_9BACT|nr:sigma-70 family RNA polymerase sigma factor [Anaerohalosphaera lusitana]AQT68475.1 RNA polymerase sigma factor [Anaerohalosphaera lusitana]
MEDYKAKNVNKDLASSAEAHSDPAYASRFFRLFMQNQKKLFKYILMLVPCRSDAEDILQDTATLMWTKFDEFKPGTNFAAWGIKIAHFKVLRYYRSRKRLHVPITDDILEIVTEQAVQAVDEKDHKIKVLQQCMKELPEKDRALIELRYDRGLAPKKVAQKVSRPVRGIYKSLSRIHNSLLVCVRRRLNQEGL